MTPLQVVKVRLAVQRLEEPAIVLNEGQFDAIPSEDVTETAPAKVAVVRLRTDSEQPAYTGMFNCIGTVVAEEGFDTLYRAWWFTFFLTLGKIRWY